MNVANMLASLEIVYRSVPEELRDQLESLMEAKLKEAVDDVLDFVENKVKGTETEIDDYIVGKFVALVRKRFEIPDDIGGDED